MHTIYAYWDAQQIQAILNGVVMITSGANYLGLLKVFAIIGLFVAVGVGFAKAQGHEAGIYVLMLAIWYGVLLVPKVSVDIQQTMGGGGNYTVANVPLGLGIFAAEESHIGYWLTTAFETVFSMPSQVGFQQAGFGFPSREITSRMEGTFADPMLNQSMMNFVINCIEPEFAINPLLMQNTLNSPTIWQSLSGQTNPGRMVSVYDPNQNQFVATQCDNNSGGGAYGILDAQITPYVSNTLLPKWAMALYPESNNASVASALIQTQTPLADQYILNSSQSTTDAIKQAAMINILKQATYDGPASLGDTATTQVALATAMAESSANISYQTMGNMAKQTLPVIRSAIHLVILALFPFVMIMIIMAGAQGGKVLKSYFLTLFWVNLWAPVYAVVNFVTSMYASSVATGATLPQMSGLTFANHTTVIHGLLSQQAVAGLLTASVPLIAYALVKGGEMATTQLASAVTAPANAAAQSAGGQIGTGNSNVGNTSWGNVTMRNKSDDQWNTAPTSRTGSPITTDVGADGVATSRSSNGTGWQTIPMNTGMGFDASSGNQLASQVSTMAESSMTASRTDSVAAATARNAVLSRISAHLSSGTHSTQSTTGATDSQGAGFGGGVDNGNTNTATAKKIADYKNQNNAIIAAQGQVSGNANYTSSMGENTTGATGAAHEPGGKGSNTTAKSTKDNKFSVGAEGKMNATQQYSAGVTQGASVGTDQQKKDGAAEQQKFFHDLATNKSFAQSMLGADADSKAIQSALQENTSRTASASAELRQAEALKQGASQTSSNSSTASYQAAAHLQLDQLNSLRSAVAAAPPGKETDAIRQWMEANGQNSGSALPGNYRDGSTVISTPDGIGNQHNKDAKGIPDNVGAAHRANEATVPHSVGIGAGAVKDTGLGAAATVYTNQTQAKTEGAMHQGDKAQTQGEKNFQNQSGLLDPHGKGMDTTTVNKLINTAGGLMADDAAMSVKQLIPNNMGGAPTLEQFQSQANREDSGLIRKGVLDAPPPQPGRNTPKGG
jgi:conjugal transfer mating pair stabilization protein TraG